MHVALISIGNCPSLALRNLRAYCQAHQDLAAEVRFSLYDYDVQTFRRARNQATEQWSYVTEFDEAVEALTREPPDLVGFSCYLWNVDLSLHLAYLLKRLRPGVEIVFGGPDVGPRGRQILQSHPQVDFVVEGDGEIPFRDLLRQRLAPETRPLASVPSLVYRLGEEIAASPPAEEMVDLSLLRDLYPRPPSPNELGAWYWPHMLYETLRGCPYSCSYCMYGKQPTNAKDPATAAAEMVALLQRGLNVEIIDPTFTTYKKRAKQILRLLGEHTYDGWLYFEAYPDSIDEEMAELISKARVHRIGLGFQTVSSAGLKAVRRPKNLQRFERAVELLRAHRIQFYVDLIYGLPGTVKGDFLASIDYLFSLGITDLMTYRLLGLPGSPMMAEVETHGFVFNEFPPYELLASNSFSLQDIIACERFYHALTRLLGAIPSADARGLATAAGGISAIVTRYQEQRPDNLATFTEELFASLPPAADSSPVFVRPADNSPAISGC